jgi:hypothetical protein
MRFKDGRPAGRSLIQAENPPTARKYALRVFGFRMWAVKYSMKRRAACGEGTNSAGQRRQSSC